MEDLKECIHLAPVLSSTCRQLLGHQGQEADTGGFGNLNLQVLRLAFLNSVGSSHSLCFFGHRTCLLLALKLAKGVFEDASELVLSILVRSLKKDLPEVLSILFVAESVDEWLGDLWATLQDFNHDVAHFLDTSVNCHTCKHLEANLRTNVKTIEFCFRVNFRLSDTLQDLENEVEEFGAVDVSFK